VLFVEKEGFDPLLEQVRLAERYDLAMMSTKGLSVTAARMLADHLCGPHGIPLFILRDFDKAGFSGVATFQQDNRRYKYRNKFEVIDLGLRLKDVRALNIEDRAEDVHDKGSREARRLNLFKNGAKEEEAEFLLDRRVELNALTSDELVEFIEKKLKRHGIKKIVPDQDTLAQAYRLFERGARIDKIVKAEIAKGDPNSPIPKKLEARVRKYLKENPAASWDDAVRAIANGLTNYRPGSREESEDDNDEE
jgi:hypothetical protein